MAEAATSGSATRTTRWVMDRAHSSVWFSARQLAISTVRGWFREFDVELEVDGEKPETAQVEASIDAASLDTGDERRDQHLRSSDFLDAEHHRWIVFRSTRVGALDGDALSMDGKLTIRDVTRPVTLALTFHGFGSGFAGERRAAFTGRATISRARWGLTWNVPIADARLVGDSIDLVMDVSFAEETASG